MNAPIALIDRYIAMRNATDEDAATLPPASGRDRLGHVDPQMNGQGHDGIDAPWSRPCRNGSRATASAAPARSTSTTTAAPLRL